VRSIRTIIYTQKKKAKKQATPNGKPSHQSWLDGLNNTSSNNNPSTRLVFIPQKKHFFPFCYTVVRWSLFGVDSSRPLSTFTNSTTKEYIQKKNLQDVLKKHFLALGEKRKA